MRVFVMFMMMVAGAFAATPLVTGDWVAVYQNESDVVIVDVSDVDAYASGHIPGAVNSPLSHWRHAVGKHAEVRSIGELQAEMRRLGIGKRSKVVVYSHQRNNKDLLKATYVIWAMEYAGFDNTFLLDGGLNSYVEATGRLSKKTEADRKGSFRAHERPAVLATLDAVRAGVKRVQMIDSRPARYYFGAERQGVLARSGHISGAHSYFWRYSLDTRNRLKPKKELEAMLETGLGLDAEAPLIVYCTGGLEASMNYFVLHRMLGFEQAKLYDASMKEWANRDDTDMTVFRWE
jgi:thiosulfate/3-mercaptopyruvate sulfurtransferase